jgi:hypothetical protein
MKKNKGLYPMKKTIVLFGNFTFHHFTEEELQLFKQDTEQKALIHEIDKVVVCDTQVEADNIVDELESSFDSWLLPTQFKGEIIYEADPTKTVEEFTG